MTGKQRVNEKKKTRKNESGYSPIPSYPCSDTGIHSKSRRKSDSESGRSMVEMLGVLAIMGVLAIGGIAGYRYAMDKYNANEILNEVRKRAVTASQQRILGHAIDLSEWSNTIQGHPVTTVDNYNGDTSFFALTVSGIEQSVCDKVIAEKIPFAVEEKVGEVVVGEDTTCAEGNNDITFAFKNTLDGEGATGGGEEPEPSDPACGQNEYQLPDGTCKEDKRCPDPNEFWNGKTRQCESCPTSGGVENNNSDLEDSCGKCNNAQEFSGEWGSYSYCVYCPKPGIACGTNCCGEGEGCDFNTKTCVPATCRQDSDCPEPTPLCNTVTGKCFKGCKTNEDCKGANEFCDLDVTTTDHSCTQKPGQGTCQSASGTKVGDTDLIRSPERLNWWSAENFCKANDNKTLIDLSNKCSNWSEIKGWGTCEELKGIESTDNSYWTKNTPSFRTAFGVNLHSGGAGLGFRNNNYYALCE